MKKTLLFTLLIVAPISANAEIINLKCKVFTASCKGLKDCSTKENSFYSKPKFMRLETFLSSSGFRREQNYISIDTNTKTYHDSYITLNEGLSVSPNSIDLKIVGANSKPRFTMGIDRITGEYKHSDLHIDGTITDVPVGEPFAIGLGSCEKISREF